MGTSSIRTMSNFPILVKNTANFPNSMGPRPIPKKGCESPGNSREIQARPNKILIVLFLFIHVKQLSNGVFRSYYDNVWKK